MTTVGAPAGAGIFRDNRAWHGGTPTLAMRFAQCRMLNTVLFTRVESMWRSVCHTRCGNRLPSMGSIFAVSSGLILAFGRLVQELCTPSPTDVGGKPRPACQTCQNPKGTA